MKSEESLQFSPSRLDTYRNCPKRYQFRYIDKIKTDRTSIEAFLGTCAHAALEKLYEGVRHGKVMTLKAALAVFAQEWARGSWDKIDIRGKEYRKEDYFKVGQDCVRTYYKDHKPFDQDRTLDVERKVEFPLDVGDGVEVTIWGYIDRLSETLTGDCKGYYEVHDYKTGANLPDQEKVDQDQQLAIYDLAVRHLWPDVPGVRLVWHYLRHGKDLVSTRSQERRLELRESLAAQVREIKDARNEFKPKKSHLCDWCEFKNSLEDEKKPGLCPAWNPVEPDLKQVDMFGKPRPKKYPQSASAQFVKKFAELESKKHGLNEEIKSIKKEQAELQEKIIEFAEERDVRMVRGSEGDISIEEKQGVGFPSRHSSSGKYEQMEAELKETAQWGDISQLDTHKLLDGVTEKRWSPSALQALSLIIERYAHPIPGKVLHFHKKKDPETD